MQDVLIRREIRNSCSVGSTGVGVRSEWVGGWGVTNVEEEGSLTFIF